MPEDPATGSANGCLGAWLLNKSGQDGLHCVVHQGEGLGKSSQILMKGHRKGRHIYISCGGWVTDVMAGQILVPLEVSL